MGGFPAATCIVADGLMPWASGIAEELGVPVPAFRTAIACSFLAYLSTSDLFELGELRSPSQPAATLTNQSSAAAATVTPTTSTPYCARSSISPCTEGRHGRSYSNTAVSMDQPQPALTHIAPRMRDVFAVGPLQSPRHALG
jgi:hypothetical protein